MGMISNQSIVKEYREQGFKNPKRAARLMTALNDAWAGFVEVDLAPTLEQVTALAPREVRVHGLVLVGGCPLQDGTQLGVRVEITLGQPE